MKQVEKSVPILVQSFSRRGEARDLICIFCGGQTDKS